SLNLSEIMASGATGIQDTFGFRIIRIVLTCTKGDRGRGDSGSEPQARLHKTEFHSARILSDLQVGGTGQSHQGVVPTVAWPVGPTLIQRGGTGQSHQGVVPTVALLVGPTLIQRLRS